MNFKTALLFLFFSVALQAQNSHLQITLKQADSLFMTRNFKLLAQNFEIQAAKALEIQAKVYPNPNVSFEFNVYDPDNNKYFHTSGTNAQKVFKIEQLILLGGKRKAELAVAKSNTKLAEIEFEKLILELQKKLHHTMAQVFEQQKLVDVYNNQYQLVQNLVTEYEKQASKGNIALKEVVRLKGALLQLNTTRSELITDYLENQESLQVLLRSNDDVKPLLTEADYQNYIKLVSLSDLQNKILQYNPELKEAQEQTVLAQAILYNEKKQRIPNITLMANYDQNSGAYANEINGGIAMDLPFFNRNKGNIKAAKYKLDQANTNNEAVKQSIVLSLQKQWKLYQNAISEYKTSQNLYSSDFDLVNKGMGENFQKRNLSILEFLDFFDTYNQSIQEITRIKIQLVEQSENLKTLLGNEF